MYITISITNDKLLSKDKLFTEIEEKEPKIKELIKEGLKNNNLMYYTKKSGVMKAIQFFEEKNTKDKKVLKLKKAIYVDSLGKADIEELEEIVKDEMKERIILENEYDEVEFKDEVLSQEKEDTKKVEIDTVELLSLLILCTGFYLTVFTEETFCGIILLVTSIDLIINSLIKTKMKKKK